MKTFADLRSSLSVSSCAVALALASTGCPSDTTTGGGGTEDGDGGSGTQGSADGGPGSGGPGGTEGGDATGGTDAGPGGPDDTGDPTDPGTGDTGKVPGVSCLDEQYIIGVSPGPNYNELGATIGTHCNGTDHQDITGIERVVFIGDSVTVGTPPTGSGDFFRTIVAAELATQFGIEAPAGNWNNANPLSGMSGVQESGAFASCSEWGARNDDLIPQLENCFAPEDFDARTLVIWTMGGNDVSSIAQDYINGEPLNVVFDQVEEMIANHEGALQWLTEQNRFPNGVFVVNANVYEYTDYTAEVLSCPAANTAVGFSANPDMPEILLASLNHINEEYMLSAVAHGTDVTFMFEGFCGHGFKSTEPSNVCFRGPGNANWFDLTCIHPTPDGHAAIAQMFLDTILE